MLRCLQDAKPASSNPGNLYAPAIRSKQHLCTENVKLKAEQKEQKKQQKVALTALESAMAAMGAELGEKKVELASLAKKAADNEASFDAAMKANSLPWHFSRYYYHCEY